MTAYLVDPSASTLRATIYSTLHTVERHGPVSGHLEVDDSHGRKPTPAGGEVRLDLTTMTSSDSLYDTELETRLDTQRYPRVVARLTEVSLDGAADRYLMAGELTFHGRTNTVRGTATVSAADGELTLAGELTLDVREFGIDPPKVLLFKVRSTVDVTLSLVARPTDPLQPPP